VAVLGIDRLAISETIYYSVVGFLIPLRPSHNSLNDLVYEFVKLSL
jgi:hypothetical protein